MNSIRDTNNLTPPHCSLGHTVSPFLYLTTRTCIRSRCISTVLAFPPHTFRYSVLHNNSFPMQEIWFVQIISNHLSRPFTSLHQSYHDKVQITNYHTFATTKTVHYSYKDTYPITQSQTRNTTRMLLQLAIQLPAQRPTLVSPLQDHPVIPQLSFFIPCPTFLQRESTLLCFGR